MQANELAVDADGRRTRGQAEDGDAAGRGALADQRGDPRSDEPREFLVAVDDHGADALECGVRGRRKFRQFLLVHPNSLDLPRAC